MEKRKKRGREEGNFPLILGLPLKSVGHQVARKKRGRLEGSRKHGQEKLIRVVESGSIRKEAKALLRQEVFGALVQDQRILELWLQKLWRDSEVGLSGCRRLRVQARVENEREGEGGIPALVWTSTSLTLGIMDFWCVDVR